ncbi:hypothetical protein BELL_0530g00050 [Botrytis elliptica]|uniref:Uncharacterized protein n=1 Tax=Botrytis elliptica TaxID=278938 RepID=A0A4Z1JDM4_9HELO|nr:hypothetical protein BELL_0530g00050 [Botrytis elliptica]
MPAISSLLNKPPETKPSGPISPGYIQRLKITGFWKVSIWVNQNGPHLVPKCVTYVVESYKS